MSANSFFRKRGRARERQSGTFSRRFVWPALASLAMLSGGFGGAPLACAHESGAPSSFDEKYLDNDADQMHALSDQGEARYVAKIRAWLKTLPPFQQQRARLILTEAHPELQKLRREIYAKKSQLSAMTFSRQTQPEDLPRLGQQLQILRRELRMKLARVSQRLKYEAGVSMGLLGDEAYWLQPLTRAPAGERQATEIKPNSLLGVFFS